MTQESTSSLPRQNVTVLGSFNPAILRPAWMARNISSVETEIEASIPELEGPPIYRSGSLVWSATRERLIVFGTPESIGECVSKILKILPHTPLSAAGVNFQFVGERSEEELPGPWTIKIDQNGVQTLLGGGPSEYSFSQSVVKDSGVKLTIKLSRRYGSDAAVVDFNFHVDAIGVVDTKRAEQLGAHAARAPQFFSEACRIAEALLGD